MEEKIVKSFLKWPGGKSALVPIIQEIIGRTGLYVEPFAGSAVNFLNTKCDRAVVADTNPHLIRTYRALQELGPEFIRYCEVFFNSVQNSKESYMNVREDFNRSTGSFELTKAVQFVWLNRHCFNGLVRFNSNGEFNVSYGSYKNPKCPSESMREFSKRSCRSGVLFKCMSFDKLIPCIEECAVSRGITNVAIYCDPPYYYPDGDGHTSYTSDGFRREDHIKLVECLKEAKKSSKILVKAVISNNDNEFTRELYKDFSKHIYLDVGRRIAGNADARKPAKEVIAIL